MVDAIRTSPKGRTLGLDRKMDLDIEDLARFLPGMEDRNLEIQRSLNRVQYKINRTLWTNTGLQYLGLGVVTGLSVILLAIAYNNLTGTNPSESLWKSMIFVLDTGALEQVL